MDVPFPFIIVALAFFFWLSTLSYLAWFRPDRLVQPLWFWRNSGYELWITRLLAPIGALMMAAILVLVFFKD